MKGTKDLTLVSAFGNVELILEYLDFFNGGERFPYNDEAAALRQSFAGVRITDIYLVCTEAVRDRFEKLGEKVRKEYGDVTLHPRFLACDDITTAEDERAMKKQVYELMGSLADGRRRIILSSGGRKTMTNRLIEAGLLYGCEGYLAITAPRPEPETDIRTRSREFNILWIPARQFYEERRENDKREGIGDNFRSLYLLPRSVIEHLRRERIGADNRNAADELAWLRSLPKADLHCHLGGAFDADLLKKLGTLMVEELRIDVRAVGDAVERACSCPVSALDSSVLRTLGPEAVHCLNNLERLFGDISPEDGIPALVSMLTPAQIDELSRDGRKMEDCRNMDLSWYMTCGDLGGSALLQTETCLRTALDWLLRVSRDDGVRYIEVRCSPENYTRQGLGLAAVMDILLDEGGQFMAKHDGFTVNFLVMATRHKSRTAMSSHVSLAVTEATRRWHDDTPQCRVVGFDLAGQEKDHDPVLFQDIFFPLHLHFINITIHAGEMEEDDKIWQALYLLHAKRIGHGLKLINNRRMMDYIRDYGTAIEMCPSSNIQTNDFAEPGREGQNSAQYPLADYLRHGIAVTVNTDNPGISATRLSREFLLAARLSKGGLTRWQVLKLIRNSFLAVFLPKDRKDRLLKEVDAAVFGIVMDEYFSKEAC